MYKAPISGTGLYTPKEKISNDDKLNTLANISTTTDFSSGVKESDLVVEAATENVELKLKI